MCLAALCLCLSDRAWAESYMLDAESGKLLETADLDPVLIDDSKAVAGRFWIINLHAYSDREQAESLVKKLGEKDFLAKVVQAKPDLYQVSIENLDSYNAAMACRARLLEITNIQPGDITIVAAPVVQTPAMATAPASEKRGGDKGALQSSGSPQPAEESSAELPVSEPEPLIAHVTLNLAEAGDYFLMVTPEHDLLVKKEVLQEIGLVEPFPGDDGTQEELSLQAMAPKLTFKLDSASGMLAIQADPSLLPVHSEHLQLRQPSTATLIQDTALFLNYNVNYSKVQGSKANVGAPLELGTNWHGISLINNFNWQKSQPIKRTQSQLVYDDRDNLQRWMAGDIQASAGSKIGSAILGGISLSKDYGLRPNLFTGPTLVLKAMLLTESEVEVRIDGNPVYKQSFPAGELDLSNIPYYRSGLGKAEIIVRDAFGRETVYDQSFYGATSLLAPGLHAYNYALGAQQLRNMHGDLRYGKKALFFGTHRYGLSDWFTPGFGLESNGRDFRGGVMGDLVLARFGQLGVVAAGSKHQGVRGGQLQVNYSYVGAGTVSPGLFYSMQTLHYGGILEPLAATATAARWNGGATLSTALGRLGSLSGRWSRSQSFAGLHSQDATLMFSTMLPWQMSMTSRFTRSWQQQAAPSNQTNISLGHAFSNGLYLSANFNRSNRSNSFGLQFQHSPPLGDGYGYSASVTAPQQGNMTSATRLQYHHRYGELDVGRSGSNRSPTYDARLNGSLLLSGGGLYLGRPVRDGFALLKVDGMQHVKVKVQSQDVGETNADGDFLLPYVHAYADNTITIDPSNIPLGYSIDSSSKIVTTGYRGGVSSPLMCKRCILLAARLGIIGMACCRRHSIRGLSMGRVRIKRA